MADSKKAPSEDGAEITVEAMQSLKRRRRTLQAFTEHIIIRPGINRTPEEERYKVILCASEAENGRQ